MNYDVTGTASGTAPRRFGGTDYVKIAMFGLASNALWQCLHIVIIPLRILDFVAESQKNTYLGLLTFCGLFLAMITQPIAGAISDRHNPSWGQRRPYILGGAIVALLLLPGFGLAGSYLALLLTYCFFQVGTNAAYGPYQAFIPDMVPGEKRGLAAGTKGLMEMLGVVAFIYPVSLLMDRYYFDHETTWLNGSLGILFFVLLVTTVLTLLLVRENPAIRQEKHSLVNTLLQTFKINTKKHRSFLWFLASRLLVFSAFTTLQQFALNFLMDVTGVDNPAEATAQFSVLGVVGILVTIWPAGYITDRIGRVPVTITACFVGVAGIVIIYLSQSFNTILVGSGFIGIAVGSFYSANWALATDLAPKNEEGRYMGLVNIATAGGATLARLIGPVIDVLNSHWENWGYRAMLLSCICYLIIGSLLMLKVKTPKAIDPA
jgi:MFS family permease